MEADWVGNYNSNYLIIKAAEVSYNKTLKMILATNF